MGVSLLFTKLAAMSSGKISLLTCGSISLDLFFPSIGADCISSPSVGPGEVGVGCFAGVAGISLVRDCFILL